MIGVTRFISHRMRQPHQVAVGTRRIDHDEIETPFHRAHRLDELLQLRSFVLGDLHGLADLDASMHGNFEVEDCATRARAGCRYSG